MTAEEYVEEFERFRQTLAEKGFAGLTDVAEATLFQSFLAQKRQAELLAEQAKMRTTLETEQEKMRESVRVEQQKMREALTGTPACAAFIPEYYGAEACAVCGQPEGQHS